MCRSLPLLHKCFSCICYQVTEFFRKNIICPKNIKFHESVKRVFPGLVILQHPSHCIQYCTASLPLFSSHGKICKVLQLPATHSGILLSYYAKVQVTQCLQWTKSRNYYLRSGGWVPISIELHETIVIISIHTKHRFESNYKYKQTVSEPQTESLAPRVCTLPSLEEFHYKQTMYHKMGES
jgi:hypothetical protein